MQLYASDNHRSLSRHSFFPWSKFEEISLLIPDSVEQRRAGETVADTLSNKPVLYEVVNIYTPNGY